MKNPHPKAEKENKNMIISALSMLTGLALAETEPQKVETLTEDKQVQPASKPKEKTFVFSGEDRIIGTLPPDFQVDADGNKVGQGFVIDHRLRPNLQFKKFGWNLTLEGDLFSGQVAGDPWDLEGNSHRLHPEKIGVLDLENFTLRKAFLEGEIASLKIQAGLVATRWGMGLVSNNGEENTLFGRADYGDRVIRTRITTQPRKDWPLFISIFGDMVIEDDMARISEDQLAFQGGTALLVASPEGHRVGTLLVYRDQTEADKVRKTQGMIMDVHAKGVFELTPAGHKVEVEAEGAHIRGTTSRFSNYNNPEGLDISAYGLTGRVTAALPADKAKFHLTGGWASGDGNPDDATMNDFHFDRDFNVGMLLFDHHQDALDVALYNQLTDPEHSGQAPDGVDALVSEGAARKVTYVQAAVEYKVTDWLDLKSGVLLPWSTAPISQGFNTFRNGGTAVNHLGEETTGHKLGTELNWGISLNGDVLKLKHIQPHLDIQGAHLMRSEDLGGGDPLSLFMVRSRFTW